MTLGIKPTVDIVFKKLLGSEEHLGLTASFVNAVLERAGRGKAESLSILNPFRLGEFRGDKDSILDIRAKDKDGREFQLEVQVRVNASLPRRILHGWAACYHSQVPKGQAYSAHRPVISVWLLEEELLRDGSWFHAFGLFDKESGLCLCDDFLIVTLELGAWKHSQTADAGAIEGNLERWLYFFSKGEGLDPERPAPPLIGEEFEEAMEIMETFTKSEAARHAYEKRLDYQRDRMDQEREDREKAQAEGRAEGLAEGRAVGRVEGRIEGARSNALETARKLKALGLSADIIAQGTGLTEEEIEKL